MWLSGCVGDALLTHCEPVAAGAGWCTQVNLIKEQLSMQYRSVAGVPGTKCTPAQLEQRIQRVNGRQSVVECVPVRIGCNVGVLCAYVCCQGLLGDSWVALVSRPAAPAATSLCLRRRFVQCCARTRDAIAVISRLLRLPSLQRPPHKMRGHA